MVYLCGRPLRNRGRCTLGRETAIQPMTWVRRRLAADAWTATGFRSLTVARARSARRIRFRRRRRARSSTRPDLPIEFQWLRIAVARGAVEPHRAPGASPSLRAGDRSAACFTSRSSPVGSSRTATARATSIEFEPEHFQQMAGLICYYNSAKFHYFYISHDETIGKHLRVMSSCPTRFRPMSFTPPIPVAGRAPIELRVEVDEERLLFAYRIGGRAVAVAAAAVRREHSVGRGECAGAAELHGRLRRHGLPGYGRHRPSRRLRLLRVPRAQLPGAADDGALISSITRPSALA